MVSRDTCLKHLRANMRRIRTEKGITRDMVGMALGVHYTTVFNWERGHTTPPAADLYLWCKFMDVDMESMFSAMD